MGPHPHALPSLTLRILGRAVICLVNGASTNCVGHAHGVNNVAHGVDAHDVRAEQHGRRCRRGSRHIALVRRTIRSDGRRQEGFP